MSSNRGIYRASLAQLDDFADGKIDRINSVSYGKQDGLLNIECNGGRQPAGYKMTDGTLWFPTQAGVAVIDPQQISINQQPPPVVIEKCLLQREDLGFRELIEVKPGQENLEIHYSGLSFINPEQVGFKYKLEGLDRDWINAGARRVAYYSYIPPGEYTFKVIAANRDRVWSTAAATLKIVVIPPFWRTWWFTTLVGLAIAGSAFLTYRRRLEKMKRAHAAQETFSRQLIESQETERKRIAGELHDSLGQNLLVIKNRAMLGTIRSEENHELKEQFDLISTSASQALSEVRQIAYNLRPYQLEQLGLTQTIDAMIENSAAATSIRFTTNITPIDGLLSEESEINVYRIIQEGINNVIKHSNATEVRIDIKRIEQAIQITVEDNGRGFAVERTSSSNRGFGLTGISERVKMIGGTHTIESTVGQGTTLTIKVNLLTDQDKK
jgi:signal transduction histidine kinase